MESPEFLDRVKRLVIIAMFSDDDLMDRLVLKGGNLLDLVYRISARASLDVDFSIDGDFEENEEALRQRIDNTLTSTFAEEGFHVFDTKVEAVPPQITEDFHDFWGGYKVEFKIIARQKYLRFEHDPEALRRNANKIGRRDSPKFTIDISRHEYCEYKRRFDFEGYTIYGLSPELFACEKLRAICQQMEEYARRLKKHAATRARDFLDFYVISEEHHLDFQGQHLQDVCKNTFDAKQVPLHLLGRIKTVRQQHEDDFLSVRDTVKPNFPLRDFGFYFDYMVEKAGLLKALWDE
ncbi:MAG: nucleotidyl transferase AbiEii/AbiGii toxin family protein [Pirellulales bacterium]|nr:nucleotidyl transferase AbiEii/AbiGii toxin family protein [Pirellulales bacterium]